MAETKNAETTAFEMGNSVATVLQYYYNWKSHGKEASEYWALTPAAVLAGNLGSGGLSETPSLHLAVVCGRSGDGLAGCAGGNTQPPF
jgi:hypothetical protein